MHPELVNLLFDVGRARTNEEILQALVDNKDIIKLYWAEEVFWVCPCCGPSYPLGRRHESLTARSIKSTVPGFCLKEAQRLGPQRCHRCKEIMALVPGEDMLIQGASNVLAEEREYDLSLLEKSHRPHIMRYQRKGFRR